MNILDSIVVFFAGRFRRPVVRERSAGGDCFVVRQTLHRASLPWSLHGNLLLRRLDQLAHQLKTRPHTHQFSIFLKTILYSRHV